MVILIQENRSFDHYFGTLSGVRGFGDKRGRGAFFQKVRTARPCTRSTCRRTCLPDLTHDWGPQHQAWNNGRWTSSCASARGGRRPGGAGSRRWATTRRARHPLLLRARRRVHDLRRVPLLGDRADRPEPADVDVGARSIPAGKAGGPLVQTRAHRARAERCSAGRRCPSACRPAGVSWKVYTDPGSGSFDNVLTYFKQYTPAPSSTTAGLDADLPERLPRRPRAQPPAAGLVAAAAGRARSSIPASRPGRR